MIKGCLKKTSNIFSLRDYNEIDITRMLGLSEKKFQILSTLL